MPANGGCCATSARIKGRVPDAARKVQAAAVTAGAATAGQRSAPVAVQSTVAARPSAPHRRAAADLVARRRSGLVAGAGKQAHTNAKLAKGSKRSKTIQGNPRPV